MMQKIRNNLLEELGLLGRILVNEPMSRHTSFRTGGPADMLIYPKDVASLSRIVHLAREYDIPFEVIGGGTNLLVGDKGIRGITVTMSEYGYAKGKIFMREDGALYADSVVRKEDFIAFCLDHGCGGIEFMAGIPGCLGGGIVMNAGTTLGNFVDILESIDFIDPAGVSRTGRITRDMAHYRRLEVEPGAIITGGCFRLPDCGNSDSARKMVEEILRERRSKHPLDYPSAGSVFKNPPDHASWKLVDDAGLKGCRIGGAMVSELHTNFIINFDNARSSDILRLIGHVRETVQARFNILLEPEIRLIGEM